MFIGLDEKFCFGLLEIKVPMDYPQEDFQWAIEYLKIE